MTTIIGEHAGYVVAMDFGNYPDKNVMIVYERATGKVLEVISMESKNCRPAPEVGYRWANKGEVITANWLGFDKNPPHLTQVDMVLSLQMPLNSRYSAEWRIPWPEDPRLVATNLKLTNNLIPGRDNTGKPYVTPHPGNDGRSNEVINFDAVKDKFYRASQTMSTMKDATMAGGYTPVEPTFQEFYGSEFEDDTTDG